MKKYDAVIVSKYIYKYNHNMVQTEGLKHSLKDCISGVK